MILIEPCDKNSCTTQQNFFHIFLLLKNEYLNKITYTAHLQDILTRLSLITIIYLNKLNINLENCIVTVYIYIGLKVHSIEICFKIIKNREGWGGGRGCNFLRTLVIYIRF